MPITKKSFKQFRIRARIASKVREKDLIDKAKALKDDYELILPDCPRECGSCPLKKTRARLEKITKYKDDPYKLAKFANRGDRLARAYAATIGLVHEEKTPYLASATYPAGTITFALRGKTDREKLIAVQNYDSPKWRVLGVANLVKKKGLHIYSFGDSFICTGREAAPPEEYVRSAAESVGASRLDGDVYSCPHSPSSVNHIEFDWVSAGKKILLCESCSSKSKNSLAKLAEGMAVPRVLNEFDISVRRPLKVVSGNGGCKGALDRQVDEDLLEDYTAGKIGDRELVEKHMQAVLEHLEGEKKRLYIRGDRCFGDDMETFVKDLTSDEVEVKAIVGLLADVENPVVLDSSDSVNKLLSRYWSTNGERALGAVVPEEVAKKHFKDDDESKRSPMKVVRQAIKESDHRTVTSKIPKYSNLSPHGMFAEDVTKAYKTRGQAGAVSVLDGNKSNDHRVRAMTHAFYLALDISTKSWKFTDEEKEFGKHLQPLAKELLTSETAEEHHAAFAALLREAGSTEDLKRA